MMPVLLTSRVKGQITLCVSCLHLRTRCCHWWCYLSCIMLTPVPMTSHNWKSHAASHFNSSVLINATVPLKIPATSCYADTNANGITSLKTSCYTPFQLSWSTNCSCVIDDIIGNVMLKLVPMASHDQKSDVAPHFHHLDVTSAMMHAIYDALSITLSHCWHQWHQMTRKVMLHLWRLNYVKEAFYEQKKVV